MTRISTMTGLIGLIAVAAQPVLADHKASHGSNVAGGLPAVEERVSALETLIAGLSPPVTAVTVDCGAGDSINDALAQGSGAAPLTITVVGTCIEDPVQVDRDDVTIQGNTLDGSGEPVDTLVGGIDVLTSHRVTIKNLVIQDGASTGIQARRGASINVSNVSISGFPDAGIGIIRHSFARIDGTDVSNPAGGDNALFLNDGSSARVTNSVLASANGAQFNGAALGLFRSSNARFDAGNTIINTNLDSEPSKAQAINILDTSNIRIQNSGNLVVGNISLESNSAADFRNLLVNGNVGLRSQVHTTLSGGTIVTGNILVDRQSLLEAFSPGPVVTGVVACTGNSGVSGGAVGGFALVGCPIL